MKEMLNNLNNDIKQYFLDGTYKIVPNFGKFKTLVTLIGFNKKANAFAHCCYTLLTDETQNIFENFLQLLKFNYKFKPKFINIDFSKAEENAILEVYKNDKIKIVFCLFHFVQCLWRKINSLGLRKKEFIKKSKCLIFNIKLLAFIKVEDIEDSYNSIKNSDIFDDDKYTLFFNYFEKNWIKKDTYKWNYFDIISLNQKSNNEIYNNDFDIKILLTNNACETLHSYIKQMVANNSNVSVYVFNNVICNLIAKNNFDSNSKRKKNEINKHNFNLMKKKFSSDLFKIACLKNKFKVFNYEEMINILGTDINEDELVLFNDN